MLDRRAFLAAASAGLGAALLAADADAVNASLRHASSSGPDGSPPPLEVLTPEQAADVDAITSQIMPTDDLPGAHEARVVNFADHSLMTWAASQKDTMVSGLAAFNAKASKAYPGVQRFAQLTSAQQIEFLRANEQDPFFQQMMFVTMTGTFANPDWGGNYDKAGWRILGFEDRYLWQPPFGWYDARANGGPN